MTNTENTTNNVTRSNNSVILEGNLADVPFYTNAGKCAFAAVRIAVDEGKNTDFLDFKVFRELADTCHTSLGKGDRVRIRGKLTKTVLEKDGKKEYRQEVNAYEVFLVRKAGQGKAAGTGEVSELVPVDPDTVPF